MRDRLTALRGYLEQLLRRPLWNMPPLLVRPRQAVDPKWERDPQALEAATGGTKPEKPNLRIVEREIPQ